MAAEEAPGLGPTGSELWRALGQRLGTPAGAVALEACRIADRLERLDRVLHGELFDVREVDDGRRLVLVVDAALSESRAQGLALLKHLQALGLDVAPAAPESGGTKTPLELARERAQQRRSG